MEDMRPGEVALFFFDINLSPVQPSGKKAPAEMHELCSVFRSKFDARLTMRGARAMIPGITVSMYDKRGRWLETQSAEGVRRRQEDLDFASFILLRPLGMAAVGIVALLAFYALRQRFYGGAPLGWRTLTPNEKFGFVLLGTFLGAVLYLAWYVLRLMLVRWSSKSAMAALGTPERLKFYKQLEKAKSVSSTPLEVELQAVEIDWPDPAQHETWARGLKELGFEQAGAYQIVRSRSCIEFFVHGEHRITANCSLAPYKDAFTEMVTRYVDGSVFTISAHESPGLDPHPMRTTIRVPRTTTVEEILEKMLRERPEKVMVTPAKEMVVPRFKQSWREYMEWRRQKGTSAEEYRRVDERRQARIRAEAMRTQEGQQEE